MIVNQISTVNATNKMQIIVQLKVSHFGGQGEKPHISVCGSGLLEESQWKSGTPSLVW